MPEPVQTDQLTVPPGHVTTNSVGDEPERERDELCRDEEQPSEASVRSFLLLREWAVVGQQLDELLRQACELGRFSSGMPSHSYASLAKLYASLGVAQGIVARLVKDIERL